MVKRKVDEKQKGLHTVKITNEYFDDIIGYSNLNNKYFTVENNDIIYKRLNSELFIESLPYLGASVDFGLGDVCLEEDNGLFKFYLIDYMKKFHYETFDNIHDAIHKLVSFYKEYEMVDDSDKMEEIFYQTLGLVKKEKMNKTLKK